MGRGGETGVMWSKAASEPSEGPENPNNVLSHGLFFLLVRQKGSVVQTASWIRSMFSYVTLLVLLFLCD